ncbi:MAG: hypothetical protein ACTSQG_04170 [Promethearchaeota archaeon]
MVIKNDTITKKNWYKVYVPLSSNVMNMLLISAPLGAAPINNETIKYTKKNTTRGSSEVENNTFRLR